MWLQMEGYAPLERVQGPGCTVGTGSRLQMEDYAPLERVQATGYRVQAPLERVELRALQAMMTCPNAYPPCASGGASHLPRLTRRADGTPSVQTMHTHRQQSTWPSVPPIHTRRQQSRSRSEGSRRLSSHRSGCLVHSPPALSKCPSRRRRPPASLPPTSTSTTSSTPTPTTNNQRHRRRVCRTHPPLRSALQGT